MKGCHCLAIERTITKLYADMVDADIPAIIDTFWNEHKEFVNRTGVFSNVNRWNVADVVDGKSYLWHEKYSLPYTEVLGYVACRTTSKILGIGAAERGWGDAKEMKDGKRSHMSAIKTEMQSIIYTTARLDEARHKRIEMEKITAGKGAQWGDDDVDLDLGLEKFGVNVAALKDGPPKRLFHCWIEDWEAPLLKKNDCVAEARLLEKYKGMVFLDIDDDIIYTVYSQNMDYQKGKNGGWCVLAMPPSYDGEKDNELEPYQINEETLIYLIANTKQPAESNVELVKRDDVSSDEDGGSNN